MLQIAKCVVALFLVVGCSSETCLASFPVSLTPGPAGLHEGIVEAQEIPIVSDREHTMEELLRSYLANDSRDTVFQTLEFLSMNSRWIDLRPYDHLVSSISPGFGRECKLAASLFDKNRLQREPLEYRLEVYRNALSDGHVELWNGSTYSRDDAAPSVALSGLSELMPLVEEHFADVVWAKYYGMSFQGFLEDYALYLGGSDYESASLLAAKRLDDIDDQVFRERMNDDEAFNKRARRVFDYVCAKNPFTGAVGPGCSHVLNIYVRQECFWRESEATRVEMGGRISTPGPGLSHPIRWLAHLQSFSVNGRSFIVHFGDARSNMGGCGFTR